MLNVRRDWTTGRSQRFLEGRVMAKRASTAAADPVDIEDLASAFHSHEDSYHAFKEVGTVNCIFVLY